MQKSKTPVPPRRLCATFFSLGKHPAWFPAVVILTLIVPLASIPAAQLKEARVSQVIKDVKLLPAQAAPRPAAVRDEVRDGTAVRTGIESRAELTFTDQTLARLGANTIFSFNEGTRNLQLNGGAMLLRVPKNAGGAQINTSAVTAAITGTTVMLEYHPNAYIKFIILEGTGRIFRKGQIGDSVLLHAGQMLIVNPKGKELPEPVDVDLDRLKKTSALITGFDPLPSDALIAREISAQEQRKSEGGLIQTNLVIFGGGTAVALLDPTHTNLLDQANSNEVRQSMQNPTPPPSTPTPPPVTPTPPPVTPTPTPTPITPTPTPSKTGTPSVISSPNPYVIDSNTVITTDPVITTNGVTAFGKIYRGSSLDGPASLWFFGATSDFDKMIGFDQNIFIGDRVPVAAFKFSALSLNGSPMITLGAGGPDNLALISVGDLISGQPGGVLDFSNLNALFLATQDGSITLSSDLTFANLPTLGVYARGAGSTLTFDAAVSGTAIVGLLSEGDIAATNSLTIAETSGPSAPEGFIISMVAGQSINIGQDLNLSITNTDTMSNALVTLNSFGDISVNGAAGISLTIDNTGADIQDTASLGIFAGGNLTTSAINLLLENHNSGLIENVASVTLDVTGTLTTTGDVNLVLDNAEAGGTIGASSFSSLNFGASTASIGGLLDLLLANNDGGNISGDASLFITSNGSLTTGGEIDFTIDNSAFSSTGFVTGGEITGNASIDLFSGNVSTGAGLFTFLFNDGGGMIDHDAAIIGAISGSLTTQGDLFFDVQNSADTNGDSTLPGGTIGGNASVLIAVGGNIVSGGLGEFAVLNNDFRFLSVGGTISGDATVDLAAASISTTSFFQPLVNNTNGIIGGSASVLVSVSSDVNVGTDTFFNILNSGGQIGGDAFSNLTAANYASGNSLQFQILNDNGNIGGGAFLTAGLSGSLTSVGDAFIDITNTGGAIGGDAAIDLSAASMSANSLLAEIDNTGGSIGGNASVALNVAGNATFAGDATVQILGSDNTGSAAINVNGGIYDAGGTFLGLIDGDGAITLTNASIHADVLKIGALGANGSLTIGGSSLSGDTQLKLYASGSNGTINFISNVSLSSNSSVIIAGNTVTVNNGVVVTIAGDDGVSASVFTNAPNYTGSGGNGSTTGTFAGNGATTQPLDQAPPFDSAAKSANKAPAQAAPGILAGVTPGGNGVTHNNGTLLAGHGPQRSALIRVANTNELLDLADKVTAASTSPRSNNPATSLRRPPRARGSDLRDEGAPRTGRASTSAALRTPFVR